MIGFNLRFMLAALMLVGLLTTTSFASKVPQSEGPVWDFESPQWEKALALTEFKVAADSGTKDPSEPTRVELLHHDNWLYIRFTAMDSRMDQLRTGELDEFADAFPQGDHGEIMLLDTHWILAFDAVGNRYDARYFDPLADSGFRIKTRKNKDSWQVIVGIPRRMDKPFTVRFTRHLDQGREEKERSSLTHRVELE